VFRCRQVVCGPTYTAISTSAGCLYIYGSLSSNRSLRHRPRLSSRPPTLGQENRPYTFPGSPVSCCDSLTAGVCFVAFLDREYTPIIADDCLEPIQLPIRPGDQVTRVSAVGETLYGLSGTVLYEWREPQNLVMRPWNKPVCLLRDWTSHVFALKPGLGQVQLPVNTGGCADLGVLLVEKREEYPVELLGSADSVIVGEQMSKQEKRTVRFAEALQKRVKIDQAKRLGSVLVCHLQNHLKFALSRIKQQVQLERVIQTLSQITIRVKYRLAFWTLQKAERNVECSPVVAHNLNAEDSTKQCLVKPSWLMQSQALQRLWRRKQGRETQLRLMRCLLQWHLIAHSLHTRLRTAAQTLYRRLRALLKQRTAHFFPRLRLSLPHSDPRLSYDTLRLRATSAQRCRPPWRAPQPTGAFKVSQVAFQPHERRLQYTQSLKLRHQENCRLRKTRGPNISALMQRIVAGRLQRAWRRLLGGRSERLEVRWKVEMMILSLRRAGLLWQKRVAWSRLVR